MNIGKAKITRNYKQRIDFGSQDLGIERADFFKQVSEMFERTVVREEDLTDVEGGIVLNAMKANRFERRECCGRPIKRK